MSSTRVHAHAPKLIGLAGYAQAGKDTAAGILQQITLSQGQSCKVLAFADSLRGLLQAIDPLVEFTGAPDEEKDYPGQRGALARYSEVVKQYGYEWTKMNTDARSYLVGLGRGAREHLGEDIWTKGVERAIRSTPTNARIVITDVRYGNEAAMITRHGGEVWLITRPGTQAANAEEEKSMSQFSPTLTVLNDRNILHLKRRILGALEMPRAEDTYAD